MKIQFSTMSNLWMVDVVGGGAPYKIDSTSNTFPENGTWVRYQSNGVHPAPQMVRAAALALLEGKSEIKLVQPAAAPPAPAAGGWTCALCTFDNAAGANACEVCDATATITVTNSLGGDGSSGGTNQLYRMLLEHEAAIGILPTTQWSDVAPSRSCAAELRENQEIRAKLPLVDTIADDVDMKVMELPFLEPPLPVQLPADELYSLVAYTHDTGSKREDNLYYQLNAQLRKRGAADRQNVLKSWGPFVHFALKGMQRLPDFKGDVYRGYPDKATTLTQYKLGRPIQWGAFTSTSTSFAATMGFTDKSTGVIFKIKVTSGKDINPYSFFPCEDEILLSPNHRFIVTCDPYEMDGYTIIDMVQQTGDPWKS
jgi:hypothetical protein